MFVYHRLGKLDTLAGLAIRYGVTVSDLKRANGLHSEMGMFALRELKVPKGQLPASHAGFQALLSQRRTPPEISTEASSALDKLRSHYGTGRLLPEAGGEEGRRAPVVGVLRDVLLLLPDLHPLRRQLAPDLQAVGVRLRLVREDEMELELRLLRHGHQFAVALLVVRRVHLERGWLWAVGAGPRRFGDGAGAVEAGVERG